MKKNNYTYVGISFVILLFGIWAVPKIIDNFADNKMATIGKVPNFNFTNQNGETISNEDYRGKVYVAEFFFTTCPDICPIMNRNMVKVQNEFYGNPNLGIASFTINPKYDTPEVLKEYASNYGVTNPNWHMLTGDKTKIYDLANAGFHIYAQEKLDEGEVFEHSGMFALIDKQGTIRSRIDENENPIIYYDGLDADTIKMLIEDIKKLIKE